jgi:hypothetical protein
MSRPASAARLAEGEAVDREPSRLRRFLSTGSQKLRRRLSRSSANAARMPERSISSSAAELLPEHDYESPGSERKAWAMIDRMDSARLRPVRPLLLSIGLLKHRQQQDHMLVPDH